MWNINGLLVSRESKMSQAKSILMVTSAPGKSIKYGAYEGNPGSISQKSEEGAYLG